MISATLKKDTVIILSIGIVLTAISIFLGLDEALAVSLHDNSSKIGWLLRQYSQIPMIIISVIFLIFILIPPLRKKYPTFNHVALVWLFTLLFGAGLLVHTILKDTIERPRPRETELLGGQATFSQPFKISPAAEFKGKSFPSGHVAMASMLLVPFFALRRRKPKIAKTILITGVFYGLLVGYGRMILGAHFLTDVIWGVLCVALTAAVGASFIKEDTQFKSRYTIAMIIFSIFCLAWFNKFTLTLNIESPAQEISFDANCQKINIHTISPDKNYKASIDISGYGGPTSWLTPTLEKGHISYSTKWGLFHDLSCEATLWIPEDIKHNIPHLNGKAP